MFFVDTYQKHQEVFQWNSLNHCRKKEKKKKEKKAREGGKCVITAEAEHLNPCSWEPKGSGSLSPRVTMESWWHVSCYKTVPPGQALSCFRHSKNDFNVSNVVNRKITLPQTCLHPKPWNLGLCDFTGPKGYWDIIKLQVLKWGSILDSPDEATRLQRSL